MNTTKYRGLTIEHPTLKRTEVKETLDYLQTTFRIVEIDNDCISTLDNAKKIIDQIHDEFEQWNKDEPEDQFKDVHEYIMSYMAEVG